MSKAHLAAYLNDHLAGSVAALEMLEHLETSQPDTDAQRFASGLRQEIADDQQELLRTMARLSVVPSQTRQAVGWLAEKMTRLKVRTEDAGSGAFAEFEYLEALSLGIEGKGLAWTTLADVDAGQSDYYRDLIERAQNQRGRVERRRLALAQRALSAER